MATVTEFTVPGDTFPLGRLFQEFPNAAVELERIVPTKGTLIPYFWVTGIDEREEERIETAFRENPDVEHIRLIDEVDGRYLLRVEWKDEYQGLLKAITTSDVNLLSGRGSNDQWVFELRSDTREGVSEFQRYCREHGINAELTALHALSTLKQGSEYDLTEAQREALVLAYERGYFDSPREQTLDDIATELGITPQSLGSRIRRGYKRLIKSTLIEE